MEGVLQNLKNYQPPMLKREELRGKKGKDDDFNGAPLLWGHPGVELRKSLNSNLPHIQGSICMGVDQINHLFAHWLPPGLRLGVRQETCW